MGVAEAVLASTSSIAAAGHLLRGQAKFWQQDYAAAADELRAAVEADSACGLAYYRLAWRSWWRHDFPAAFAALEAGLRTPRSARPRWLALMEALQYFLMG